MTALPCSRIRWLWSRSRRPNRALVIATVGIANPASIGINGSLLNCPHSTAIANAIMVIDIAE